MFWDVSCLFFSFSFFACSEVLHVWMLLWFCPVCVWMVFVLCGCVGFGLVLGSHGFVNNGFLSNLKNSGSLSVSFSRERAEVLFQAVLLLGTHFGCPDKWDALCFHARPPRVELRATSWPVCIFLGNTFWYREKNTHAIFRRRFGGRVLLTSDLSRTNKAQLGGSSGGSSGSQRLKSSAGPWIRRWPHRFVAIR